MLNFGGLSSRVFHKAPLLITPITKEAIMHYEVQGKIVQRRGKVHFAVPKALSLTDRIANAGQSYGAWDRQMTKPAIRLRNTRSIRG